LEALTYPCHELSELELSAYYRYKVDQRKREKLKRLQVFVVEKSFSFWRGGSHCTGGRRLASVGAHAGVLWGIPAGAHRPAALFEVLLNPHGGSCAEAASDRVLGWVVLMGN
jgi:hypothetical protein